jgi:hypothetical protein
MSTSPVAVGPVPVPQGSQAPAPAPAAPLTAIQIVEQQIQGFIQQHEKAVSNVHAIEGAIQAHQSLLMRLRQEEVKAIAYAKKLGDAAITEAKQAAESAEGTQS